MPTDPAPTDAPAGSPVPDTMLAAVITRHGGPDVIDLRQVAVPRPGPGEVLTEVSAAGCNNTDLWTREGSYGTGAVRAHKIVVPRLGQRDPVCDRLL